MLEKKPYQKPDIRNEKLEFRPDRNPEGLAYISVELAKTKDGTTIYKKDREPELKKEAIKKAAEERRILQKLEKAGISVEKTFSSVESNLVIALGAGNKNLDNLLPKLEIDRQNKILKDVGVQLAKMHNEGVIHRDMCAINVVADKLDKVTLIDFTSAQERGQTSDNFLSGAKADLSFFVSSIANYVSREQIQLLVQTYFDNIKLPQEQLEKLKTEIARV